MSVRFFLPVCVIADGAAAAGQIAHAQARSRCVQEDSILRRHGHDASTRDAFLEEVGMSEVEWREWITHDARQQATHFEAAPMDTRSPEDIMEDIIPEKRLFNEITEPIYDTTKMMEAFEYGPFALKSALPEHLHVRPSAILRLLSSSSRSSRYYVMQNQPDRVRPRGAS